MTYNSEYDNLKQYKSNKIRYYIFGSSTTWDSIAMYPMFDPTGVQTHNLKIMSVPYAREKTCDTTRNYFCEKPHLIQDEGVEKLCLTDCVKQLENVSSCKCTLLDI